MSLLICNTISEFNIEKISFNIPIKNKVIKNMNSTFISLIYTSLISITNVCITFSINNPVLIELKEKCDGSYKYKCFFQDKNNSILIDFFSKIEDVFFDKYLDMFPYSYKNIERVYMLKKCVSSFNKYIKFYKLINNPSKNIHIPNEIESEFILKISGIWENNGKIGLSYKIVQPSVL